MVKPFFFIATIGLVLYSCANDKKDETRKQKTEDLIDSTLVTDTSWGVITISTDFDGLKKVFGEASVVDERICGPECVDSIDVTKVYKKTNKEFVIHWEENAYHKKITMIETYATASPFHTPEGLKIGSSMQDIVNINGKPINFMGFGWDYGGGISNYNQGKLDSSNVHFRLDLTGEM